MQIVIGIYPTGCVKQINGRSVSVGTQLNLRRGGVVGEDLFFGVIAASYQGAGFYVADAFGFAAGFPSVKLVGVDPAFYR
jgi:hypothetical protein